MRSAKDIFLDAIQLPREEQASFVASEASEKPELEREVIALVRAHQQNKKCLFDDNDVGSILSLADVAEILETSGFIGGKLGKSRQLDLPRLEGQSIGGRYKIVCELGRGSFGMVYRARESHPVVREVALRIFRHFVSEQSVARLVAEKKRMAGLAHPNVVLVFDVGQMEEDKDLAYVAMELVDGDSADAYCLHHELSIEDRMGLFGDICREVHHAHHNGFIHGDIQPNKIIVANVDGRPVPKVTGFRNGKSYVERLWTASTLDTTASLAHLAPEQLVGLQGQVDVRSDVYGLGVLLNQLVTGDVPLKPDGAAAKNLGQQMDYFCRAIPPLASVQIQERKPNRFANSIGLDIEGLANRVRGSIDGTIAKCLEKSPEFRYQSVMEVAQDIENCLSSNFVQKGQAGLLQRLRRYVERKRRTR